VQIFTNLGIGNGGPRRPPGLRQGMINKLDKVGLGLAYL